MNSFHSRLQYLENIITRLRNRISFLDKKSNRFSFYRLTIFIAGAAITTAGFFISKEIGWTLLVISLSIFSTIVHFHNKLLYGMKRCYEYLKIKEDNLARMKIDWKKIPEPILCTIPGDMTSAKDLDLLGKYSLHNLIDVAISMEGSRLLENWITNYSPGKNNEKKITEKQRIIKELSGLSLFRDKFLLKANLVSRKYLNCERILKWVSEASTIKLSKWLVPVSSILIASYIILFLLYAFGYAGSLWMIFFLINFFIYFTRQKKINKLFEESLELENQLKKFTAVITFISKNTFEKSPYVRNFLKPFNSYERNASDKLSELQQTISAILVRENLIIRLITNMMFPYDFFFCRKLIRVKSEIEKLIPEWLGILNEFECYISLSNFAYLNPDYVFPDIESTDKNVLETKLLGHPLIKREYKVCNDFNLKKENEIVIITGSNMSGKSTFLRTVGVNLCLAYAGAPVNAGAFKTSLFELFTCIKVNDSVVDGTSYFYAEVKKLKELLDELQNDNGSKDFFLIDEIFKGTNNRERLVGSRAFIKKLAELKGTGFISTHDLELVNLEKEISILENYHFREEIVNGEMEFDYKIHDGPCPTTNALKIMELAGLPVK